MKRLLFVLVGIAFLAIATACDVALPPQYIVVTATPSADVAAPKATSVPKPQSNEETHDGWTIAYLKGATDQMKSWGRDLKALVTDWSKFPNVDFPKYDFRAKDGVEYGMAESAYCQRSQTCDVNTAAMHYRLISGYYVVNGIDECTSKDGQGCAIAIFNVGRITAMFRESKVDYGFTVTGRYWNGDAMPITIRALGSNTVYNMIIADKVNPGANCSVPEGCSSVRFTVVVISGNELLMKAVTVVTR